MEYATQNSQRNFSSRSQWRFGNKNVVILYILLLFIQKNCLASADKVESSTKNDTLGLDLVNKDCHSCQSSSDKAEKANLHLEDKKSNITENSNNYIEDTDFTDNILGKINEFSEKYMIVNRSMRFLEKKVEYLLDKVLSKDSFEIIDGVEIKSVNDSSIKEGNYNLDVTEGRALFSKYTYEYRIFQKIRNFIRTHTVSINLPKAAQFMDFRSFGLNKFFVPLLIGGQVILKSILFAMFLPSILGSFGKILGKGISQLSATSSQASYPPANADTEQPGYNNENKDFAGYETNQAGSYAYPQDGMYQNFDANNVNDVGNDDMSRYGADSQKMAFLNSKNSYYKNQMASATNNYKVFQKIPASSMILSNYDPFYSPLLSRLDGIFARLGLAPSENSIDTGIRVGGQTATEMKLEACREQLICLMYASPAKYAPYSNLVSAQLSRELNELRRPVSDNPEILRFFRYMRSARRGQEGADCVRSFPMCAANAVPAHTMIAAYHDINKLVSARKLNLD